MRIKLFSHNDMDGVGCSIVLKQAYGKYNVDTSLCDYDASNVNDAVNEFIDDKGYLYYDKVFITDISVDLSTAKRIDSIDELKSNIRLLDHHATAEVLNKYSWAKVNIFREGSSIKTCGTELVYNEEMVKEDLVKEDLVSQFVEVVCQYDTWRWHELGNKEPKMWNDLFYIIGAKRFEEALLSVLEKGDFSIPSEYSLILELEQNKINAYAEKKSKQIISKTIQGYNAGIVFAEQYQSELGNTLAAMYPEYDFIVMIDMAKSIGYRSIGDKLDLGKDIASVYGGGGHANASGSSISDTIRKRVIDSIFGQ